MAVIRRIMSITPPVETSKLECKVIVIIVLLPRIHTIHGSEKGSSRS